MNVSTRRNTHGRHLAAAIAITAASLVVVPMTNALAQAAATARADASFMEQAAQNGHAEIESSRLALDKANDPRVRQFAQLMISDHTKVDTELRALALLKGVELPDSASLMQKGKARLLSLSNGENFDRRYMQNMGVTAHQDTIELFTRQAAESRDPEIKAFASDQLPTLQDHLAMATRLVSALNAADAPPSRGSSH